jgi:hypothetical protein
MIELRYIVLLLQVTLDFDGTYSAELKIRLEEMLL